MGFFIYIMCCDLLVPLVMVIGGWFMWKRPPKKVNGYVGYRTAMSMKNKDTWDFAQKKCGAIWCRVGLWMLPLTLLAHLPFAKSGEDAVSILSIVVIMVQIVVLLCSIRPVEKSLRAAFDNNGNRKEAE